MSSGLLRLASGRWLLAVSCRHNAKRKAHSVEILSFRLKSGFSILGPMLYAPCFFYPLVKLEYFKSEPQNRRISNNEFRREVSLRSIIFFKNRPFSERLTTGRIHSFDIRHSVFDVRYSLFQSFLVNQADRYAASGWADT
jgi:hypothetical protein